MDGLVLNKPGFCFNRITDFVCYMWMNESSTIFDPFADYEYDYGDYGDADNYSKKMIL